MVSDSTARFLAAEDMAQDAVAVVDRVAKLAGIVEVPVVIAVLQRLHQPFQAALGAEVAFDAARQCWREMLQGIARIGLVDANLLGNLADRRTVLWIEQILEHTHGLLLCCPVRPCSPHHSISLWPGTSEIGGPSFPYLIRRLFILVPTDS